jgi:hypothetical protein
LYKEHCDLKLTTTSKNKKKKMRAVVIVLALVVAASATTPIPRQNPLSKEERVRLDAIEAKQNELRNSGPPMMHGSPHGPHFVNAHLKSGDSEKMRKTEEVMTAMFPDDAYRRKRFVHLAPKDGLLPRGDTTASGSYGIEARWSPATTNNGIRISVNWNDAEAQAGIGRELVHLAFRDAANEWQSISKAVPKFRFVDTPTLDVPSSYRKPMPIRNGENEFAIMQHDGDDASGIGHDTLGGVYLWIDKATGYIVEADGYLMLHDHDGKHLKWHVGNGHHHPENNFHLRRTMLALIGHVLGLKYSNEPNHAMTSISAPGERMRLAQGDRNGILALYSSP